MGLNNHEAEANSGNTRILKKTRTLPILEGFLKNVSLAVGKKVDLKMEFFVELANEMVIFLLPTNGPTIHSTGRSR